MLVLMVKGTTWKFILRSLEVMGAMAMIFHFLEFYWLLVPTSLLLLCSRALEQRNQRWCTYKKGHDCVRNNWRHTKGPLISILLGPMFKWNLKYSLSFTLICWYIVAVAADSHGSELNYRTFWLLTELCKLAFSGSFCIFSVMVHVCNWFLPLKFPSLITKHLA